MAEYQPAIGMVYVNFLPKEQLADKCQKKTIPLYKIIHSLIVLIEFIQWFGMRLEKTHAAPWNHFILILIRLWEFYTCPVLRFIFIGLWHESAPFWRKWIGMAWLEEVLWVLPRSRPHHSLIEFELLTLWHILFRRILVCWWVEPEWQRVQCSREPCSSEWWGCGSSEGSKQHNIFRWPQLPSCRWSRPVWSCRMDNGTRGRWPGGALDSRPPTKLGKTPGWQTWCGGCRTLPSLENVKHKIVNAVCSSSTHQCK